LIRNVHARLFSKLLKVGDSAANGTSGTSIMIGMIAHGPHVTRTYLDCPSNSLCAQFR
jgi:hypothetical protein